MMAKHGLTLAMALLVTAPLATGCSGADDAGAADQQDVKQASREGVKSNVLGTVAAIQIDGSAIVAAPAKVSRILEATGLDAKSKKPKAGALRCLGNYHLEFFGDRGESLGVADYLCEEDRTASPGTLRAGEKEYLVTGNLDAIDEVGEEPLLVGDVLWGIDEVVIGRPKNDFTTSYTDKVDIKAILEAVNRDQSPDPEAPVAKCLPTLVLDFMSDGETKGVVSSVCSEQEGEVAAQLSTEGVRFGEITIDLGPILEIEASD